MNYSKDKQILATYITAPFKILVAFCVMLIFLPFFIIYERELNDIRDELN